MGLGRLLTRNLTYQVTGTGSHAGLAPQVFELVTDSPYGPLASPGWAGSGPYQGAMALPGCWRAAVLMSDLLGSVPYHAYRAGPDDMPVRVSPAPTLLDQPAPPESRMSTFSSAGLDLIWHGNAVGLIVARNRDGWATAVAPKPASSVGVRRVAERERDPDLAGMAPGTPVYRIDGRWWHWRDVWHVKGPSEPGALRGFGLLEVHLAGVLKLAADLGEQARGVADHAVPSMVIKSLDPTLDAPGAEELKDAVVRSQRTRRPLVLNPTTDVEPLSWNPTETQLIEARKLSLLEQALVMGLDPSWLGAAQTSRVYSNLEGESINLWRYSGLAGHVARIEAALSAAFPRGVWVEANLDAKMRADTLTRYQAHAIAYGKWLTADEIRHLERRPALTPAQRRELVPAPPFAPAAGGGGGQDGAPDNVQDDSEEGTP